MSLAVCPMIPLFLRIGDWGDHGWPFFPSRVHETIEELTFESKPAQRQILTTD